MPDILAISGSPIKAGNIERAIGHIIKSSGAEGEQVRLGALDIRPCLGCLKCVRENRCAQRDGMTKLLEQIIDANALIIGAFPSFFSLNALTKTFIERLFALKHNRMLTKGKLAVAVSGGFRDAGVVDQYLRSFFGWMKMETVGTLVIGGNAPCLFCGDGEVCAYSNIPALFGPSARITPDKTYRFEDDAIAVQKAAELGLRLGAALAEKR